MRRVEINMRRYASGDAVAGHESFYDRGEVNDLVYLQRANQAYICASTGVAGERLIIHRGPDSRPDHAVEAILDRGYPVQHGGEECGLIAGWQLSEGLLTTESCDQTGSSISRTASLVVDDAIGPRNHIRLTIAGNAMSLIEHRTSPEGNPSTRTLWSFELSPLHRRIGLRMAIVDGEVVVWWNPYGRLDFVDEPIGRAHTLLGGAARMGLFMRRDCRFMAVTFEYRTASLGRQVGTTDVIEAAIDLAPVRLRLSADETRPPLETGMLVMHADDTRLPERQERLSRIYLRDGRFLLRPGHSYRAVAWVRTVDDEMVVVKSREFSVDGDPEDLSLRDCYGRLITAGQVSDETDAATEPPFAVIAGAFSHLDGVVYGQDCSLDHADDPCAPNVVAFCSDISTCRDNGCPLTATGADGRAISLVGCAVRAELCVPVPLTSEWPVGCDQYPYRTEIYAVYEDQSYYEVLGTPACSEILERGTARRLATPELFALLYTEAADINFGDMGVSKDVFDFIDTDLASDAAFITAIATKIPDAGAVGEGSLDCEAAPVQLPTSAAGYYLAGWTTIADTIIARLDRGHELRPGVRLGIYQQPFINIYDATGTDPTSIANREAWIAAYELPTGIIRVLGAAKSIQPEIYPHNRSATLQQIRTFVNTNLDLCRRINTLVSPEKSRRVIPFLYVTDPGDPYNGRSPNTPQDFLPAAELAMYLQALREAGADAIFIAGAHLQYDPATWQEWADTTFLEALVLAGYMGTGDPGSVNPQLLGSWTAGSDIEILVWPSELLPVEGIKTSVAPGRSDMIQTMDNVDRGVTRSSLAPRMFEFNIQPDPAMLAILKRFRGETMGRVRPFVWTHPRTGEIVVVRFANMSYEQSSLGANISEVEITLIEEPRCLTQEIVSPESSGYSGTTSSAPPGQEPVLPGMGACCLLNGQCVETTKSRCAELNGSYHGNGTSCRQVDCSIATPFTCETDCIPVCNSFALQCGGSGSEVPCDQCLDLGCPLTSGSGASLCGCYIRDIGSCHRFCNGTGQQCGNSGSVQRLTEHWCCYTDGKVMVHSDTGGESVVAYCCARAFSCARVQPENQIAPCSTIVDNCCQGQRS